MHGIVVKLQVKIGASYTAVVFNVGSGDPLWSLRGLQGVSLIPYIERIYDNFGHGFHTLYVIKNLKAKIQSDPGTKSYEIGVHGLISL